MDTDEHNFTEERATFLFQKERGQTRHKALAPAGAGAGGLPPRATPPATLALGAAQAGSHDLGLKDLCFWDVHGERGVSLSSAGAGAGGRPKLFRGARLRQRLYSLTPGAAEVRVVTSMA